MAGAFSFVLGMLGLGAAGAVSAGQNAKIKKADYQYGEEHGLHGTSEVLQMRERVRKEWWSMELIQIYVIGMVSKMVTSDLSARINDVLRYVGITRNMNAYMILSQALTLIAEDEDRLRAVEKEIYTPIADKNLRGPRAVQSTVRRASKVAWDFFPDRVQELAGYPLNGRPSAVAMLELLYNGVARYDDLSILK